MTLPLLCVTAAAVAYLVGALPFGLLVARWVAGVDIRTLGSGNIGATNVGRVVGAKWGIGVLVLDACKGMLPTLLLPMLLSEEQSHLSNHLAVLSGLCAILGHMFPVWLGFRGGKGVATALGVIAVLGWQATLVAFLVFAVVFGCFRIVSLSSMLAAIAYGTTQIIWLLPHPFGSNQWSLSGFSLMIPALIILRHRTNLVRLWQGTEPKFRAGEEREQPESPPAG